VAKFAEQQLGKWTAGKSSYLRDNGECIGAWKVEIRLLCHIYDRLGIYTASLEKYKDESDDYTYNHWIKVMPYFSKLIAIMEPWTLKTAYLDEQKINDLFDAFSLAENCLSIGCTALNNLDKADHYSKRSVFQEGKERLSRFDLPG
jgi:hypothetical protein